MHSPARQRPAERSLPLSQRTYLAFLGRISPEKGLDTAIRKGPPARFARRIAARKPLRQSANPNVPADWEHYRRDVRPLLEQDHTQLLSEVDDRAKDQFLGQAAALLFPIRWPEPFGWS